MSVGGCRQQKILWFILLLLGILAVIVNLRLVSVCSNNAIISNAATEDNNNLSMLQLPPSSSSLRRTSRAANRHDTSTTLTRPAQQPQYPRVLCFFMVSRNSLVDALAVRYGIWGKRCAMFAIITNGLDEGEGGGGPQYLDNNTTILLDIQYIIREELQIRNWHNSIHATEGRHAGYITFPSPSRETKNHLSLKSFYAWIYLSRHYSNNYTTAYDGPNIDYIMKVDPDTYMIMDNYLSYLHEYYTPQQHAYIGRVFKTEGNVNDPFVSGLSVTLSTATTSLLLSQSSILQYVNVDNNNNNNEDETISTTAATTSGGAANKQKHQQQSYECSAERFVFGGAADDHTLSRCLMSLGIYPSYTRDDSGRHERFMHYSPTDHYPSIPSISTSNVLIKYFNANDDKKHEEPEWYAKFSWTPYSSKRGCCSSVACAFHYVGMDKQNSTLVWDKLFHTWHWEK